jgi:hypothetical protein
MQRLYAHTPPRHPLYIPLAPALLLDQRYDQQCCLLRAPTKPPLREKGDFEAECVPPLAFLAPYLLRGLLPIAALRMRPHSQPKTAFHGTWYSVSSPCIFGVNRTRGMQGSPVQLNVVWSYSVRKGQQMQVKAIRQHIPLFGSRRPRLQEGRDTWPDRPGSVLSPTGQDRAGQRTMLCPTQQDQPSAWPCWD